METIAQEAKRLLEPIPDDKWIIDAFCNGRDSCCAVGHYTRLKSGSQENFTLSNCGDFWVGPLRIPSEEFLSESGGDISDVNNGPSEAYPQSTPKQRVMALLDDMIAAGY